MIRDPQTIPVAETLAHLDVEESGWFWKRRLRPRGEGPSEGLVALLGRSPAED